MIAPGTSTKLIWNKKDVTKDLSPYLSSIEFNDNEEAMSDEVAIKLDNSTGFFFEDWYPAIGDTIEVYMGYTTKLLYCGLFEVDETTLSGKPDMIEVKTIAAGIKVALRTRNNHVFESQTLKQIAEYFCKKYSFTLVDTSGMLSQINLDRKTQEEKTDLQFLSEIAKEYGFIFSIRGSKMLFTSYYALDNADAVKDLYIMNNTVSSYDIKEKVYDTYAALKIKARNKKTNAVVEYADAAEDAEKFGTAEGSSSDTLNLSKGVTNKAQASAKVKGGLWSKNKYKQTATIEMAGDPDCEVGYNINLLGIGAASGKYHIYSSSHKIDGAYTTTVELRRTGFVPKPQRVPKKETTSTSSDYADVGDTETEEGEAL